MEIIIGNYIAIKSKSKSNNTQIYSFYEIKSKNYIKISINRSNDLWTRSSDFRHICTEILANTDLKSYYFKLPEIISGKEHLQFILIKEDKLDNIKEDSVTYNEYFVEQKKKCNQKGIITFHSIYEDVLLIVPCPNKSKIYKQEYSGSGGGSGSSGSGGGNFKTISTFMRTAPTKQINEFWKTLANSLKQILNSNRIHKLPLYVYTHGLGVYWFHLRIEETRYPKYYFKL